VKNFTSAAFNATFNPPKHKEIDRWKNSDPQRLYIDAHTHRVMPAASDDATHGADVGEITTVGHGDVV
jgi:hypothetical protein